jgi:hypothetical protein
LCTRNHKKVKATTAKMAKVDGAGMALFQKIDYGTIAHNADGQREFVLLTMVPSR